MLDAGFARVNVPGSQQYRGHFQQGQITENAQRVNAAAV